MKEKRGFTLLEMIVTVAILFTLLSILVPTMSGFAKSAGDQISDSNLELLNFATHSYASFHEIENKDIFESVADDAARQQVLVSDGLIEQPVHPNGEGIIVGTLPIRNGSAMFSPRKAAAAVISHHPIRMVH